MPRSRPILAFVALAFALSWAWWLGMLAMGLRVGPGTTASHLPGVLGPALAAMLVTGWTEGRAGLMRLARAAFTAKRPGFAAVAIALPVIAAGSVLATQLAMGRPLPPYAAFTTYPGVPAQMASLPALLVILLLNGYGEELGWRGYLFENLLPGWGKLRATLLVSGVWVTWHLPLFWLNTSMAGLVGPMLIGWIIGLVLGAFVLSHLYLATGHSVLAASLWHVGYNLCVATPATAGAIAAAVTTLVMAWGALVIWSWARGRTLSGA